MTFKCLTSELINKNLIKAEYAVRGPVVNRAAIISKELENKAHKYKFKKIIYTNIGNPHSVEQKPLTWPKQVLSLLEFPEKEKYKTYIKQVYPKDVIDRVTTIETAMKGGLGSYSDSAGVELFRKEIAEFIDRRDNLNSSEYKDIYITNGASSGINTILQTIMDKPTDACMIPIPQYPIYSASLDLLNSTILGYYLNESSNWSLDLGEIEKNIIEKSDKHHIKAFVLINPGNPTGQNLSMEVLRNICRLCHKYGIILLADEVYQENIYGDNSFVSCKRAAYEENVLDELQLISFHSTSKGLFGECGRRGGYMEILNIDPSVKSEIHKLTTINLCPNTTGQVMTSLMVRQPKESDESFEKHESEKKNIYDDLKRKSSLMVDKLNDIDGIECRRSEGAMYCFPSIDLPDEFVNKAKAENITPDTKYALSLLENTGICIVPACGFKQKDNRYGFRTTFLPPYSEIEYVVEKIKWHHLNKIN